MLMLKIYKVLVVKTEPRLHFGVQCNVNVGSSGGYLVRKLLYSPGLYKTALFGQFGITLGSINKVPKYMK